MHVCLVREIYRATAARVSAHHLGPSEEGRGETELWLHEKDERAGVD